jgi:uncharacterized protein
MLGQDEEPMEPEMKNGKICYIDIPATEVAHSAAFYSRVFGWTVRQRGDGATSFDDTTGQVSGTWTIGRPPATPGFVIYVMVRDIEATLKSVTENGGKIVQPVGADLPEITARVSDPAGNVIGVYQERTLANR